jgi:hypothetical protein
MDLDGWQMLQPCPCRIREVQRQVADNHHISGGTAQLASQAVVVEPYPRVCLPRVLGDGGGLAEALGKFAVLISRLNTRVPRGSGVGQRSSQLL